MERVWKFWTGNKPKCSGGARIKKRLYYRHFWAKMAKVNQRNFIGIDISAEYCEIAKKRLEKVNNHKITDFFGVSE